MEKIGINKKAGVSIYLSIGVSIYLSAIGSGQFI
jgi:hypothetical protein